MPSAADSASTPYLAKLNEAQREAVLTTEGPLLVLAGAGTGKTRVLTSRIAHIIRQGMASPHQILAVTFTNKAAREMKERVEQMLHGIPGGAAGMWLGTFHSLGARILRSHADRLGLSRDFTILDTDDQLRLIKQLLSERNIDPKRTPPTMVLNVIQSWKDKGLTPDKVEQDGHGTRDMVLPLYRAYQERLLTVNAVDFGDLLLHPLTLFTKYSDVLSSYANRFHYILVDEYQDTNTVQYLWLRLLAMSHRNICCVGDDDQSIYSWRGAEVANILGFQKDFPGAHVIRLEENYRSTPHILAVASHLISYNKDRLGKTLRTPLESGDKPIIRSFPDDREEARAIGESIHTLNRQGDMLDQMAILVRAGFQTRPFEEAFIAMSIPYRVVGGMRFYERKEIRDMIAYLRWLVQPHDELALSRLMMVPKRGIGETTLEKLVIHAHSANISLWDTFRQQQEMGGLKGKAKEAAAELIRQHASWNERREQHVSPSQTLLMLMEESGYQSMLQAEQTQEAEGRLENLREMVRAMDEFESITQFLEHVSLVADRDFDNNDEPMAMIMTMHTAKGLEFDTVFLPGWEEGLFPHQRAMDEQGLKGLEEERRLAYVGITRARKRLAISHASTRRVHGQWQSCIPSRFLSELPSEHLDQPDQFSARRTLKEQVDDILNSVRQRSAEPRQTSKPADGFHVGAKVKHTSFGTGRILAFKEDRLQIVFEQAGIKTILKDFVTLA
ncbi:AAA family ATPase [bacterium]|nr:AAA family ATPase [bacterium]